MISALKTPLAEDHDSKHADSQAEDSQIPFTSQATLRPEEIDRISADGVSAFHSGDYIGAIERFEYINNAFPDHEANKQNLTIALCHYAINLVDRSRVADAMARIDQAKTLAADHAMVRDAEVRIHFSLAERFASDQALDDALASYANARALNPQNDLIRLRVFQTCNAVAVERLADGALGEALEC